MIVYVRESVHWRFISKEWVLDTHLVFSLWTMQVWMILWNVISILVTVSNSVISKPHTAVTEEILNVFFHIGYFYTTHPWEKLIAWGKVWDLKRVGFANRGLENYKKSYDTLCLQLYIKKL